MEIQNTPLFICRQAAGGQAGGHTGTQQTHTRSAMRSETCLTLVRWSTGDGFQGEGAPRGVGGAGWLAACGGLLAWVGYDGLAAAEES